MKGCFMRKQKNYSCIRKVFLTVTFLLFASLSALAEEVSKTVELTEAGTLSTLITDDEKNTITNLTVSGSINSDDVATMKSMVTSGALSVIDMSGATTTNTDLIESYTFEDCNKLTSISLPNGITSIGEEAFYYCSSLVSVTIPNSVTSIGQGAFSGCSKLTSITIPNSVTSIGSYAFYSCTDLASIIIPNSVTSIGDCAFYRCTSLAEVTLLGTTLPDCTTDAFYNVDLSKATLYYAPGLDTSSAPWSSFGSKGSVVTLTSEVRLSDYISDANKSTVTKLKIYGEINSEDIALMADMARSGALSVIDMSEATAASEDLIGYRVFDYCSKLTSISLPKGITSIGYMAFYYCSNLTSVIIPDNVTRIYSYAFGYCSSLTSVVMGKSVTNIEGYAFWDCNNLKEVIVKDIAAWCGISFSDSESNPLHYAKHLYGADGVEIKDLEIPNSVINISNWAFSGCSGLTSITIPSSAESIGKYAFHNCTGLTSVTIGSGMTSIGDQAFYNCSSLTSITIPNSVTSIGDYAFYNCSSLTSITLPESLTIIDYGVFHACSSLTSVTIPNSVKEIKGMAFRVCEKLTSVTIPNSVTSIDYSVFQECTGLTSVVIGNSVTSIGSGAFRDCSSLTEVTLLGTTLPTTCATNAFEYIDLSKATLYCKAALVETCKVTEPWKNFKNIVVKSFSITISDAGIATGCFDDDLNFSEVTGVKAYIASGFNPETGKVLMTNVTEVPAGTGFLVKGEEGTYKIPAAETKYVYVNMLVGTLEETTVAKTTEDNSYTNYVLANDATNGVGFYLADNNTVSANRAYLQIPTSAVATGGASEAKTIISLSFDDEDDTTGITQIGEQSDDASGNAVIYNLNGQRKQSLTKGLNIVNGKKIFVK